MEFSADNKEEVTVSLSRIVFIECPLCHKEVELKMWSSINTLENPEYKAAVRDLSAFKFICPECGEKYDLASGSAVPQNGLSHEALRRMNLINSDGKLTITQR